MTTYTLCAESAEPNRKRFHLFLANKAKQLLVAGFSLLESNFFLCLHLLCTFLSWYIIYAHLYTHVYTEFICSV